MNSLSINAYIPVCLPDFEHINRFWDKTRQLPMAKILPGEYYVSIENELISTVLGSCVSACIRDVRLGIGGVNHFMLPSHEHCDAMSLGNDAARYGTFAMEQLINSIFKLGGKPEHLEIKIVGGGKILSSMGDIGESNIQFVKAFLLREGLTWIAEDTGGPHPRKIIYIPQTGVLKVKKLKRLQNDTIFQRERSYEASLFHGTDGGIELFE